MPRKPTLQPYNQDDEIVGYGEVQSQVQPCGRLGWILPGREVTFNRQRARHYAKRLNSMVQANMKRYDRSLIW